MNKLEDVPELKATFEKVSHEFGLRFAPNSYRITAEHFFIAGRDSVKPKRTIAEVHQMDDSFYVVSDDRKMFHWQGNTMGWYALPEIPQD